VLGLYTGARRGELRALRWEAVDFEKKIIRIASNFVEEDGLKDPKANSKREIILPAPLEDLLLETLEVAKVVGEDRPDSYIILNPKDFSKPCSDSIDDAWPSEPSRVYQRSESLRGCVHVKEQQPIFTRGAGTIRSACSRTAGRA
jgi:integrase